MKNAVFTVIRSDTERTIVHLGTAPTMKNAQEIMHADFKHLFEEKYAYEMQQHDISYEKMLEKLIDSDELGINETSAYLNECHHVDFDWSIFKINCSN